MTKDRANKIVDAFKYDPEMKALGIRAEVIRDRSGSGYRFNWRDGGWDVRITHTLMADKGSK